MRRAQVVIEKHVKELCPLLSNFVVIGDRRKFLSALATIKCEIDPNTGRATDQLTPQAQVRWDFFGGEGGLVDCFVCD